MTRVLLGIGSNIDPVKNICAGLDALQQTFGELMLSSVYRSEALGFQGDAFLNLVVGLDSSNSVGQLAHQLRQLEHVMGRPEHATRFSSRTLDIDILTYADQCGLVDGVQLPRGEITENAFVLCPLAELVPAVIHPATGLDYASLWCAYTNPAQPVQQVDFWWGNRQISRLLD
jgi:2-amino-4-hydroxy-6-hydroxymethyldihydropteridine diphosphokinase